MVESNNAALFPEEEAAFPADDGNLPEEEAGLPADEGDLLPAEPGFPEEAGNLPAEVEEAKAPKV